MLPRIRVAIAIRFVPIVEIHPGWSGRLAVAGEAWLLGRNAFHVEIQFRQSGKSGNVNSRVPGISGGILDGKNVVRRCCVSIDDNVIRDSRHVECPIHFALVVARHGVNASIDYPKEAAEQIAARDRDRPRDRRL